MNLRYINEDGILFELLYVKNEGNSLRNIVCKRVVDKKVLTFSEKDFTERFQAA